MLTRYAPFKLLILLGNKKKLTKNKCINNNNN